MRDSPPLNTPWVKRYISISSLTMLWDCLALIFWCLSSRPLKPVLFSDCIDYMQRTLGEVWQGPVHTLAPGPAIAALALYPRETAIRPASTAFTNAFLNGPTSLRNECNSLRVRLPFARRRSTNIKASFA